MLDNLIDVNNLSPKGSHDCPYKLAIIGGGPSGCSVIVRAVRTGTADILCSSDEELKLSGVCIIDKSGPDRFGGGRLQDYAINSNTFASKFASNVLNEKFDTLPPESCKGSYFEKIKNNDSCQQLVEYGNKQGSLKVVGQFLCDVGKSVAETLYDYPDSSSCFTGTSIDAVQRYQRSDGLMGWKLSTTSTDDCKKSDIYAKDVLFATGGRQETPVLINNFHNNKVLGRYTSSLLKSIYITSNDFRLVFYCFILLLKSLQVLLIIILPMPSY